MKITPIPFDNPPYYLRVGYSVHKGIVTIHVETLVHTYKVTQLPTQYLLEYFQTHYRSVCNQVRDKVAQRYGLTSTQVCS
jgi:hypothetical protein